MKKDEKKEKEANRLNRPDVRDVWTRVTMNKIILIGRRSDSGFRANIFVAQNLEKAPPGCRSRSPGLARGHPPARGSDKPEKYNVFPSDQTLLQKEKERFNNKNNENSKQNKHLKSIIMKKQILFLSMFILALFAGINSSFGQKNPDTNVWAAPNCGSSDEYHPAVGVPMTYSVAISGTGYSGSGTYSWLVTKDVDLLNGAAAPAADFSSTAGGTTDDNIIITWNASSIGSTYYVVVNYAETNSSGGSCNINNVKVFPVQPRNAFWLDINASTDGTVAGEPTASGTAAFNVCAPNVSTATITTPGDITVAEVKYEFGTTTLYAIIHAAGYTGDFDATLKVSGLEDNQAISSITYGSGTAWTPGTVDATGNGDYSGTLTSDVAGVDIPVTIVITNNQHETLTDQAIKISIDGSYTAGGTTYNDLSDANGACTDESADADYIIQTVKARPTITPSNPTTPGFATPNPALK